MNSGLVSIAINMASGFSRARIGLVNVPTPGPYSTNSLADDQSTGFSILSISTRLDGMTEPTMTGCRRKPLKNCQRGLLRCRPARRPSRRLPFSWLARVAFKTGSLNPQYRATRSQIAKRLARQLGVFRESSSGLKCGEMQLLPDRPRVAGSALTTSHFLLLYAAMLVAAAGNTALQSVMPAIGREIGISDFWVTVSYTWSAILWVT